MNQAYRYLNVGDKIEAGDEYISLQGWLPVEIEIGHEVGNGGVNYYRRPIDLGEHPDDRLRAGDWPEDWGEENGKYQNNCSVCHRFFYANKRRVVCKVCAFDAKNKDDRIRELEDWKDSATQVFNQLKLEEIGKLIGVKLGDSIADKILPYIRNRSRASDRHEVAAREIGDRFEIDEEFAAEIIAKHFPEDDSWVERAAEEIVERWKDDFPAPVAAKIIIYEIINGCRRG